MTRLIDPKTFRLELDKLDCIDKFGYVNLPITKLNIALERSTVDAVPVVRCKDCANYAGDGMYCAWDLLTGDMGYCHHGYVADKAAATEETCADGERKGGDE